MGERAGLVLAAALLLAVFVGLAGVVSGSASRGSFSAPGSTYRAAPDGVRGLYLLADAMGVPASRRHVDLEVVEEDDVLVLVATSAGASCEADRPHVRKGKPREGPPTDADDPDGEVDDAADVDDGGGDTKRDTRRAAPRSGSLQVPALTALECRALLEWVAAGGRVVHLTDRPDAFLAAIGLQLEPMGSGEGKKPAAGGGVDFEGVGEVVREGESGFEGEGAGAGAGEGEDDEGEGDDASSRFRSNRLVLPTFDREPVRLVPGQPTPLVGGAREVLTPIAGRIVGDGSEIVLLEDEEGAAVAVAHYHGHGRVVVVAAPALATNRWLAEADNALFWAGLLQGIAGGSAVQFVEHRRGFGEERSIIAYLLGRGLGPALVQVGLVFVLATAAARRLGRPLPLPPERLRVGGDHLSAMSRLYQVGGHGLHAGERIAERALEQARRRAGDPRVAAAVDALEGARMRLRKLSVAGEGKERDVAEVARRAAAVYDALSRKRHT